VQEADGVFYRSLQELSTGNHKSAVEPHANNSSFEHAQQERVFGLPVKSGLSF
jgi:hypothetical protein